MAPVTMRSRADAKGAHGREAGANGRAPDFEGDICHRLQQALDLGVKEHFGASHVTLRRIGAILKLPTAADGRLRHLRRSEHHDES